MVDVTNTSGTFIEGHVRHKNINDNFEKGYDKLNSNKSFFKITPLYSIKNNLNFISDKTRYAYV